MSKFVFMTVLMVTGLILFSGRVSLAGAGATAGKYIDDSAITTQVEAIIVKDPDARYFKIDVTTTHGNVVLTGVIYDKKVEKQLIAKIRKIDGVKSVKSYLRVQEKR